MGDWINEYTYAHIELFGVKKIVGLAHRCGFSYIQVVDKSNHKIPFGAICHLWMHTNTRTHTHTRVVIGTRGWGGWENVDSVGS